MTKTAAPTSGAERLTNLERVLRSLINRALHARATNIRRRRFRRRTDDRTRRGGVLHPKSRR